MNDANDELTWMLLGYHLGRILGEAAAVGTLNEVSAIPALNGLKAGLRDCGTTEALSILKQVEDWTVQDIINIREGVVPNARNERKV